MEVADVAPALQERLGPDGTAGLLELFAAARDEWTGDVTTVAVERFERRLAEEGAKGRVALAQTEAALRLEMREGDARLRDEMRELGSRLRAEMATLGADLRAEMASLRYDLRSEMGTLGSDLRSEMATLRHEHLAGRFEVLKWCFVFWVGQVFAVAGVVAVVFRLMQI